jgi:glycerophosphoryl diester phosphodiesterase
MKKRTAAYLLGLTGAGIGVYTFLKQRSQPVAAHPFLSNQGVLAMAHRGGGGQWPENTLYAFQRAVALGVDVLEMDIHSTADGVLVVRHDPTVDSTTDGSGLIHAFTLAELKRLDAGYRWTPDGGETFPYRRQGITIPTLEEVLEAFPGMRVNIDIKQATPSIVTPFCRMLQDYDRLEHTLVGSFHQDQLNLFRQACPEVATAAGVNEVRLFFALNRSFLDGAFQPKAQAFQIPEYESGLHVVTKRFIQGAHRHNVQVHVWTVDEVEEMQRLIEWGVDGIITDYPNRLMKLLGRI